MSEPVDLPMETSDKENEPKEEKVEEKREEKMENGDGEDSDQDEKPLQRTVIQVCKRLIGCLLLTV